MEKNEQDLLGEIDNIENLVQKALESSDYESAKNHHKDMISCFKRLENFHKEIGDHRKSKIDHALGDKIDAQFIKLYHSKKDCSKLPELEDPIRRKLIKASKLYEELGLYEDAKECYVELANYYYDIGATDKEYDYIDIGYKLMSSKIIEQENNLIQLKAESEYNRGIASLRLSLFYRFRFELPRSLDLLKSAKESFSKSIELHSKINDEDDIEKCESYENICDAAIHEMVGFLLTFSDANKAEQELSLAKESFGKAKENSDPNIYRIVEEEISLLDSTSHWFKAIDLFRKKDFDSADKFFKKSVTALEEIVNNSRNENTKLFYEYERKTRNLQYSFLQCIEFFSRDDFDKIEENLNDLLGFCKDINNFINGLPPELNALYAPQKYFYLCHELIAKGLVSHIECIRLRLNEKENALKLLKNAIDAYSEASDSLVKILNINPLIQENIIQICNNLKSKAENYSKFLLNFGPYCPWLNRECKDTFSKKDQCFIVYDYNMDENERFEESIPIITMKYGLESRIAQYLESSQSVPIFCEGICKEIRQSKLVIADISNKNTNVGLEIGIAWRFNIPVILIIRESSKDQAPFDLKPFRFNIVYKDIYDLQKKLPQKLENMAKVIRTSTGT